MCSFLKKLWFFWNLPVLLQRWCSPPWWVYTDTQGNRKSPEYFKIFEKTTIFNEHPVSYILYTLAWMRISRSRKGKEKDWWKIKFWLINMYIYIILGIWIFFSHPANFNRILYLHISFPCQKNCGFLRPFSKICK